MRRASPRRSRRARSPGRAAGARILAGGALVSLAPLALGCAASPAVVAPAEPAAVAGAFELAFETLRAAVDAGDEEVARRILAGIRARRPPPRLARVADAYERILDGRAAVRALDLSLAVEAAEGERGRLVLVLAARHSEPEALVLDLPPGTVRRTTVAIAPDGSEGRAVRTSATRAVSGLEIPPGEEVRVVVGRFDPARGPALATRETLRLELRSGAIRARGARLPAADPPAPEVELLVLAPFLPAAPVEPAELVRYVREAPEIHAPPLVERAVRIAAERREEALQLLVPLVVELAREDPERVTAAAPALRWLARTGRPGADPLAWAEWLAAWSAARARAEEAPERPALDLPERLP